MKSENRKMLVSTLAQMGEMAKMASYELAASSADDRNSCLSNMADTLVKESAYIETENKKDVADARKKGLSKAMVDRLMLDSGRIREMADTLRAMAKLDDPLGKTLSSCIRPNGLRIDKVSVPIGVIGIVYEARPNVTVDAAALCLKAGNAVLLRGGSEAINTNIALAHCINRACTASGLPHGTVQLLPWTDRQAVEILLGLDQYIDLIIPRGGESLIRTVVELSRIPVIKHYKGVCHAYIDSECDLGMAERIVVNAKCQRPGVCNAIEKILIHKAIARRAVPRLAKALEGEGVEIRGDSSFRKLHPKCKPASESDWSEEYLDLIIAAKIVPDLASAIEHINRYGSHHSETIVTGVAENAEQFLNKVDSAAVYWNASTRFTDGGQFGMGAEIGISTDKLHARGPMGLTELTTYKYRIYGSGQCRE